MKHFYIAIILFFFMPISLFAQWNEINLANDDLGGFTALAEHKGKLFGISYNKKLVVSSDNGQSFSDITTDTLPGTLNSIVSAESRLYIQTFEPLNNLRSLIWFSEDEGQSWDLDTANSGANPLYFYSYNKETELIIQFGGVENYYHKSSTGPEWKGIDEFNRSTDRDPIDFAFSNDTIIAGAPLGIEMSTDNAVTWTTLPKVGLPNFIGVKHIAFANNRIYLANQDFRQKMKLHYSDDLGQNWDTLAIGHLLGKNGFGQHVTSSRMLAIGSEVFIGLGNDGANTSIDMIYSKDKGQTWEIDTVGLTTDPFGTNSIRSFETHNGQVFSVAALGQVFVRDLKSNGGTTTVANKSNSHRKIKVYPNPVSSFLTIENAQAGIVRLFSIDGQLVKHTQTNGTRTTLNVGDLSQGLYFLSTEHSENRFKVIIP